MASECGVSVSSSEVIMRGNNTHCTLFPLAMVFLPLGFFLARFLMRQYPKRILNDVQSRGNVMNIFIILIVHINHHIHDLYD